MRHSRFIKNAAVLTATSLILRTVGIFFRIYLSRRIGAEGMGLYQVILSLYLLVSAFAASGISTAVTRLTAEELACGSARSVRRLLRRAVTLSLIIGAISGAAVFFGAYPLGRLWLQDTRAVPALRILAFSLPSMGVSSCLRGYFLARRRVGNASWAQLIEQAVRIGVICAILTYRSADTATACGIVLFGDTVAEWVACGVLAIGYFRDRRRLRAIPALAGNGKPPRLRRLLGIAVPITAGRYLTSLLRTVETVLVPGRLAAYGDSDERALSQFGALRGMALPLIFFPASFLSALSSLMIPELSSAAALRRSSAVQRAVTSSLRLTLTLAFPIGAAFTVLSSELGMWLYGSADVALYLRVLGPLTPVMYAESIADGMLKGLNQQTHSLLYSVVDSVSRIGLILALVPRAGMGGFLAIMVASNLLTSFLNLRRLVTVTGLVPPWHDWLFRPLFSAATAAAAATVPLQHLVGMSPIPRIAIGGATLVAVYGVSLWAVGGLSRRQRKNACIAIAAN